MGKFQIDFFIFKTRVFFVAEVAHSWALANSDCESYANPLFLSLPGNWGLQRYVVCMLNFIIWYEWTHWALWVTIVLHLFLTTLLSVLEGKKQIGQNQIWMQSMALSSTHLCQCSSLHSYCCLTRRNLTLKVWNYHSYLWFFFIFGCRWETFGLDLRLCGTCFWFTL